MPALLFLLRERCAYRSPGLGNSWRPPTLNDPGNDGGVAADLRVPDTTTDRKPFGILYTGSRMKMRDITDGSSNIFMVAGRAFRCGAGSWVGARNPNGNGTSGTIITWHRFVSR